MEVDGDVVGDHAVFDLLAAVPPKQVDDRRVRAVLVPRAVEREIAEHRGVMLDRRDQPQPFAQVVQLPVRVCESLWRQNLFEHVLDQLEHRRRIDAVADEEFTNHLVVGRCVQGLLTDEPAHVVGEFGILHQRQCLVERLDEPMFGRGQHDIEEVDHGGRDRMARNPLERDVGHVEVHLASLDLYRARVDFPIESVRSQHAPGV